MASEEPITIDLILLGDPSVGKTSIINRYVSDNFDPVSVSTEPQDGGYEAVRHLHFRTIRHPLAHQHKKPIFRPDPVIPFSVPPWESYPKLTSQMRENCRNGGPSN